MKTLFNKKMPAEQPTPPKSKLRWYQYRLRSLFILTFLVALACSWLAVKMQQANRQKQAVEALRKLGAFVKVESGSSWLRKILGDDFFNEVTSVYLSSSSYRRLTDSDLRLLMDLNGIQDLWLEGYDMHISNEGLKILQRLPRLESLDLGSDDFNDDSLKQIACLTQLKELGLSSDHFTEKGFRLLKELTHLRRLSLVGVKITKVQMAEIVEFGQLEEIVLDGLGLADDANDLLKKSLPKVKIEYYYD
jgi:hypothetical protein